MFSKVPMNKQGRLFSVIHNLKSSSIEYSHTMFQIYYTNTVATRVLVNIFPDFPWKKTSKFWTQPRGRTHIYCATCADAEGFTRKLTQYALHHMYHTSTWFICRLDLCALTLLRMFYVRWASYNRVTPLRFFLVLGFRWALFLYMIYLVYGKEKNREGPTFHHLTFVYPPSNGERNRKANPTSLIELRYFSRWVWMRFVLYMSR